VWEWNTLCIEFGCVSKGQIQSLKFNSAKLKPLSFFAVRVHQQHRRSGNTKVTFDLAHNSAKSLESGHLQILQVGNTYQPRTKKIASSEDLSHPEDTENLQLKLFLGTKPLQSVWLL
jgi:hypothetical protein